MEPVLRCLESATQRSLQRLDTRGRALGGPHVIYSE
jgi:hypothetical protein